MTEKLVIKDKEYIIEYSDTPEPEPQPCFPTLSKKERFAGLLITTLIGYYLQWGSLSSLVSTLKTWQPASFAIPYTMGNIVSMAGTLFVVSFQEQLNSITDYNRRTVSSVFFGSMAISLLVPLFFSNVLARFVTIVAVGTQMVSYWIYLFSYIPFGRKVLYSCCSCCFDLTKRAVRR